MAELPEIEIARRDLDKDVGGRKIKTVDVPGAKRVVESASTKKAFSASLEGRKIASVRRAGLHLRLAWYLHALTGAVIFKPMIGALDALTRHFPMGERHEAVRAGILQRRHCAVTGTVKHHRLVHDSPAERPVIQLPRPGGYIPTIAKIHGLVRSLCCFDEDPSFPVTTKIYKFAHRR